MHLIKGQAGNKTAITVQGINERQRRQVQIRSVPDTQLVKLDMSTGAKA